MEIHKKWLEQMDWGWEVALEFTLGMIISFICLDALIVRGINEYISSLCLVTKWEGKAHDIPHIKNYEKKC